jgi:hypothetical protein
MRKKERIPLRGGFEFDALTGWRHVLKLGRGAHRAAKRAYSRRLRKALKLRDRAAD